MRGGAYMAYTWSKASVKEKEGLSAGGGGLVGREIQYAVKFHFNFQIQWIIVQL